MFINDFDLKIHLYGDEDNFGLLTIDDGRLNGDKEHDNQIFNKLPQASFPIKKITPEKIGKVIDTYIGTYLTEMQVSDYKDAVVYFDISSLELIETELNHFIYYTLFFGKKGEILKELEEKYVEISFVKNLSFESFFLKFNDSLKNDEIKKIMTSLCYLIYGKNGKDLTHSARKSVVNISRMTLLGLESENYVEHIAVINALKNQGNIKNGVNFDDSPYDIEFDNFAEFVLDYGSKQKNFDDSKKYSSHIFFTSVDFMSMILLRLDYHLISGEKENAVLRSKIYCDTPYSYHFLHAKKKANENDYKFRYGVMKK